MEKNIILPSNPFTEDLELQLFSFYKQFSLYGCTYMYYTITDPNKGRIRFTTNEDWIRLYLEDNLVSHDPIKIICEQKRNAILSWKNIPISSRSQKKTMEGRNSFGLHDGMNIIHFDEKNGLHKILALCTDCKSHNFSQEILENNPLFKENIMKIFSLI